MASTTDTPSTPAALRPGVAPGPAAGAAGPSAQPQGSGHPAEPPAPRVRIQEADFDVAAEIATLQEGRTDIGAVATFVGCVRGHSPQDDISALTLEHYPGMTERAIEAMIDEAQRRFAVLGARVVHRVGRLLPGERIVLVAAAASHRRDAFQACEFLMDYLKTHAPFWKKESTPAGERWVDARVADDAALERWGIASANATGASLDSMG